MIFAVHGLAWADPAQSALTHARDLERAGQVQLAYEHLRPWLDRAPEDYPVVLQVGWLAFSSQDYPTAERAYRQAHDLSPHALDPSLGLAWTLLRLDRVDEARSLAEALAVRSDDPRVDELLAATAPRAGARWQASVLGTTGGSLGSGLGAGGRVRYDRWGPRMVGGLAAQALAYVVDGTAPATAASAARQNRNGNGGPPGNETPIAGAGFGGNGGAAAGAPWRGGSPGADVDLWGRIGVASTARGLEGVGAALLQTRSDIEPGWVGGLLGRVSPAGDLRAELSLTQPRSRASRVPQAAVSWFLPVGPWAIQPGVAGQWVEAEPLPRASLTLWALPEQAGVWAGGGLGVSAHPTSLTSLTSLQWTGRVHHQLWAGARLGRLSERWVSVAWSADWLETEPGAALAVAHSLVLTFSASP